MVSKAFLTGFCVGLRMDDVLPDESLTAAGRGAVHQPAPMYPAAKAKALRYACPPLRTATPACAYGIDRSMRSVRGCRWRAGSTERITVLARPMMAARGTLPKKRESWLSSRLSPIMK